MKENGTSADEKLTTAGLWCGRSADHETSDAGLGDDHDADLVGRTDETEPIREYLKQLDVFIT